MSEADKHLRAVALHALQGNVAAKVPRVIPRHGQAKALASHGKRSCGVAVAVCVRCSDKSECDLLGCCVEIRVSVSASVNVSVSYVVVSCVGSLSVRISCLA